MTKTSRCADAARLGIDGNDAGRANDTQIKLDSVLLKAPISNTAVEESPQSTRAICSQGLSKTRVENRDSKQIGLRQP